MTGLSHGGVVAFELCSGYPGRFAAALPIAAYHPASLIATNHPGNYWLVCNEAEVSSSEMCEAIQRLSQTVRDRGGDFRFSTYPDTGHDAWSKTWRESALWDWLFFSPIVLTWSRMAGFSRDTGLCRFTAREPFRFLRVVVDADAAAPLVIREAHVE